LSGRAIVRPGDRPNGQLPDWAMTRLGDRPVGLREIVVVSVSRRPSDREAGRLCGRAIARLGDSTAERKDRTEDRPVDRKTEPSSKRVFAQPNDRTTGTSPARAIMRADDHRIGPSDGQAIADRVMVSNDVCQSVCATARTWCNQLTICFVCSHMSIAVLQQDDSHANSISNIVITIWDCCSTYEWNSCSTDRRQIWE
jgi:hypothetical protein